MYAIAQSNDNTLIWLAHSASALQPGQVRLCIEAAAVNRVDLMQRKGLYPAPHGYSNRVSPDTVSANKTKRLMLLLLLTAASLLPRISYAERWCFTYAQTNYEQLYCEIVAKGAGSSLPSFYQFKNNNTTTQALLLKPHARKIGVDIVIPRMSKKLNKFAASNKLNQSKNASDINPVNTTSLAMANSTAAVSSLTNINYSSDVAALNDPNNLGACVIEKNKIECEKISYQLIANVNNSKLAPGVFTAENTMGISAYGGALDNNEQVALYLRQTYAHYLYKMLGIGLGGSTLTFNKFVYLFHDLNEKNINFYQRFDTMYYYLKQDKQRMAVNTQIVAPDQLSLNYCNKLGGMAVCDVANKNYIYLPVD